MTEIFLPPKPWIDMVIKKIKPIGSQTWVPTLQANVLPTRLSQKTPVCCHFWDLLAVKGLECTVKKLGCWRSIYWLQCLRKSTATRQNRSWIERFRSWVCDPHVFWRQAHVSNRYGGEYKMVLCCAVLINITMCFFLQGIPTTFRRLLVIRSKRYL